MSLPTDKDDEVDGRYIGAVCEYASTCDWCGKLAMHEAMTMDPDTQLGYCEECMETVPELEYLIDMGL